MKKVRTVVSLLIFYWLCGSTGVFAQKITLGVWKQNFDFGGSYIVDSSELYEGKLKLPDTSYYWYVLRAKDTFEINKVRPQMELLKQKNYKLLWLQHPNDFFNFLQGHVNDEFLPDGLWYNYARGRQYTGIFFERSIRNKRLYGKYETKDEMGRTVEYFELKDNKFQGVVFWAETKDSKERVILGIDIYEKGELVKSLYRRNR